jgi:ABC-2 type transport system ATP-binding protein
MGLVTCDERSFYWRLSGRHNLEFFATLYGVPPVRARARVQELLEVLGLAAAADRPFHGYSSGMKQKLAIARGLLANPALILYDEPTRSLDPLSAQNIRAWILRNREEFPRTAHLLATNLLHEAELLCDRVVIVNHGTVIASGTMAEIRRAWQGHEFAEHRVTCRGLSPALALPAPGEGLLECSLDGREGDTSVLRVRETSGGPGLSRVLSSLLSAGVTVVQCESHEATFDEVFCSLVARPRPPAAGGTA